MSTQPPPTPPTPANLPPQALNFLAAHHNAQISLLATLQTTIISLRQRYSTLKTQHPSLTRNISLWDMRAINRAAKAKITEMLELLGWDFDAQFGTDYQPGWVKEEVLKKARQGYGEVYVTRLEIAQLERMCDQLENPAAQGGERGSGLEAWGEVFQNGSHSDEEEDDGPGYTEWEEW